MPYIVKDWKDYPNSTTPLNAAALEDLELRLSNYADATGGTGGIPTVLGFGAVGDGTVDDTNAVKAAIATGKDVILPPGLRFKITDELVLNANQSIVGIGGGLGGPELAWSTDLGTGKYAVRWPPDVGGFRCRLQGVRILGPGWMGTGTNPSNTPGVSPANMRGVLVSPGGAVFDVASHGFNSGFEFRENNEWFMNIRTGGNLVGIRAAAGATSGDQVFQNVVGDRDYLAGIHIDVNASIGGARIATMFFANVPYGVYAPSGGGSQAMLGCEIVDFGCEGYGNGIMYAGGTRGFINLTLRRCGEGSGFAGPSIAANTKDAAIHGYTVSFWSDNGFPAAVGDVSIIRGDGQVTGMWTEMDNPLAVANTANKPMIYTGETGDALFGSTSQARVIEFCRSVSGNTVAPNELVETYSNGVRRWLSGVPRGVALAANYTNGPIPVVQSGIVPIKSTDTVFNGTNTWVKANTVTSATVVSASGPTDGAIVGSNVAGLSGGNVKVKLKGLA